MDSKKFGLKALVQSLSADTVNLQVAAEMYFRGHHGDAKILHSLVHVRQYLMPAVYTEPMTDEDILRSDFHSAVVAKEKFLTDYVLSYLLGTDGR